MIRRPRPCTLGIAALAAAACGGPPKPVDTFVVPPPPERGAQIHVPAFRVPANQERFFCTFSDVVLAEDTDVNAVVAVQRPGGHHSIIFATEPGFTRDPATVPCNDTDMASYQFRLIGAGGAEQSTAEKGYHFPPGIAQTVRKGSQLVVQSHYVNASDAPSLAEDYVNVHYAEPGTVAIHADAWALVSLKFQIDPGQPQTVVIPCEASVDTNVFYVLGHTHAWGKRFVLTHEDRDGKATTLYDEVGGERLQFDPPIIEYPHDRPLLIRKGDKLRAQCAWQNTTDHVLRFPEEMCAALMFYYPARGFLTCHEFDSVE